MKILINKKMALIIFPCLFLLISCHEDPMDKALKECINDCHPSSDDVGMLLQNPEDVTIEKNYFEEIVDMDDQQEKDIVSEEETQKITEKTTEPSFDTFKTKDTEEKE